MSDTDNDTARRKTRVALLSVVSNAVLVAIKLVVGIMAGSVSIISEAVHSGVDLVAAAIALAAVRVSGKPADERHPFGHGKYENVSGAVEALLIFAAAAWIVFEAVRKLLHPEPVTWVGLGMAVMALSAACNLVVSRRLMKVGRETDSIALRADAWHLRTDVYTSAGVMAGLGAMALGARLWPGTPLGWVDPVAAIIVAAMILKAAWDLTAESAHGLLDVGLSADEVAWLQTHLASRYPVVRGFHGMRTRKAGASRFVEFHAILDADMTVAAAHAVSEDIENAIAMRLPHTHVNIHVEPCDGSCKPVCLRGCRVPAAERPRPSSRMPYR